MMGRNNRGIRRASMRVRLAVAAAVLVGGGAVGAVAVATSHSSAPSVADSAGYATSSSSPYSWMNNMSWVMNNWNTAQTQSIVVITKTVTVKTFTTTTWHNKPFAFQRGTVVAKAPWEFVVQSTNGQFGVWHFNGNTKFLNVGNSKSGWNAMSGGYMSSWGSWNWSDYANSSWNSHTKTLANGDLVLVFGQKVHGVWWAQLVLFAAPTSWNSSTSPSMSWNWNTGTPMSSSSTSGSFSGSTNYTTVNGQTAVTGSHS
jgi:hypothetical protein